MLIHKETKTQLQPEKTMHPRSLSSSLRYYKAMQEKLLLQKYLHGLLESPSANLKMASLIMMGMRQWSWTQISAWIGVLLAHSPHRLGNTYLEHIAGKLWGADGRLYCLSNLPILTEQSKKF